MCGLVGNQLMQQPVKTNNAEYLNVQYVCLAFKIQGHDINAGYLKSISTQKRQCCVKPTGQGGILRSFNVNM